MSATARGEAAEYRQRGWSPIPIKRRSKHPNLHELEPYLYRAATTEELNSWAWPGVGIVTGQVSGVLVLDVDGPEGEAELKKHGRAGRRMHPAGTAQQSPHQPSREHAPAWPGRSGDPRRPAGDERAALSA